MDIKLQKFEKNFSLPRTIKGNPTLYLILLFISLAIVIFFVLRGEIREFSLTGFICLFIFPLSLTMVSLYLGSFRIIIYDDRLKYKKFRVKEKEIFFSEIRRLDIENYVSRGDKFPAKNGLYLNIYTKEALFMIYACFSRKDLTFLVNVISSKVPSMEINEFASQVKEGRFEGITLSTLPAKWSAEKYQQNFLMLTKRNMQISRSGLVLMK